jgi:DNA modification methylase
MRKIELNRLIENQKSIEIFGVDDDDDNRLLLSVSLDGILEPLIVYPIDSQESVFQIVSGNRRFRVAQKLEFENVPVQVIKPIVIDELICISHNEYRERKLSHILLAYNKYNEIHNLGQGKRGSERKIAIKLRSEIFNNVHKSTMDRLVNCHTAMTELANGDEQVYKELLKGLDLNGSASGYRNYLYSKVKEERNRKRIGEIDVLRHNEITIYKKSSEFMEELDDESVQTIVCSPPYFRMRDYENGDGQLGQEETLEEFVLRLAKHFDDAFRVLKPRGSLFVNLADKKEDGEIVPLVLSFAQAMIGQNWKWVDNVTWVKRNAQYTHGKSSTCVHENILHFVKTIQYDYSLDWMKTSEKVDDGILVASGTKNVKFKSAWDFRHPFVTTNTPNNHWLREACQEEGIEMTHSATYPREIPLMSLLSTAKEGDLIVDMFNGSGTTAQVAEELGMRYVGYELNNSYMAITKCRLVNYQRFMNVELLKSA